jgi:hypothetical protein
MAIKKNSPKAPVATLRDSRVENILAYMAAAVIGTSVLTMIATLIAVGSGFKGLPSAIGIVPVVGFPIGFLLVFSLLIINLVRRSRENKKTQK